MPKDEKERDKRWFPVLIACAVLIGVSMWVSVLLPPSGPTAAREVTTTATTVSEFPQQVAVRDGVVVRLSADGERVLEVYEVYAAALPAEEQARLQAGITVNNEQELYALLENYTG